jgi:hypothetical protein
LKNTKGNKLQIMNRVSVKDCFLLCTAFLAKHLAQSDVRPVVNFNLNPKSKPVLWKAANIGRWKLYLACMRCG